MSRLHWFPEPFQPHGGLAAAGFKNVLGRPGAEPLIVLVREAVQNSWDARRDPTGGVTFALRGWILDREQLTALREQVFVAGPPFGLPLAEVLGRREVMMLAATDTGTTGLGGPVRADRPPSRDEASDFADLVFNVGQPPDKKFGGGTYGFGKTINYVVSEAGAALIHTRTRHRGRLESRLIGAALGDPYSDSGRNFTGRHWWGRVDQGAVEPIVGAAADQIAGSVGLPLFAADETGTTVVVVAPRLEGRTPLQAMTLMSNAITWNFWPKLVPVRARQTMHFSVEFAGEQIAVPDPDRTPPLHAYARALGALRERADGRRVEDDSVELREVRSLRPDLHLGWLALSRTEFRRRVDLDEGELDDEAPHTAAAIGGTAHHVALMRQAELVVKYMEGPEFPSKAIEWAGVFKAAPGVDSAFAASEPPTHDDWVPHGVTDRGQRRSVNVAIREIGRITRDVFAAPAPTGGPVDELSAVVIAEALSGLIAHTTGTGPQRQRPTGTRESRRTGRRPVPSLTEEGHWLSEDNGFRLTEIQFKVSAATGSSGTVVEPVAAVATHDGSGVEKDPPLGSEPVTVLGFKRKIGDPLLVEGSTLLVESPDTRPWIVTVRSDPDVAVAVDFHLTSSDAG